MIRIRSCTAVGLSILDHHLCLYIALLGDHWFRSLGTNKSCGRDPGSVPIATGSAGHAAHRRAWNKGKRTAGLEKRLRPNSETIMMLKDHMIKSTLMDLRLTRWFGRQRSSTAISKMVRRPAASCLIDFRITTPSLLLRLQPFPCPWTIIVTWTLESTMLYSTQTKCFACSRLRAKIRKTLSFVILWTSSGRTGGLNQKNCIFTW